MSGEAREVAVLVSTWYGDEVEALARVVRSRIGEGTASLVFTGGAASLEIAGESVLICEADDESTVGQE